ncbi:hypothetical protein [Endozoicomonas sp. ONNA1]|uniref:hypothetical protein n=2 Tax=unclassified Endozoicomonas TaxID=2644528 RepID=UPI002148B747|nr:hypothetical protein [Endozoicomonas sp. ONNA1]
MNPSPYWLLLGGDDGGTYWSLISKFAVGILIVITRSFIKIEGLKTSLCWFHGRGSKA